MKARPAHVLRMITRLSKKYPDLDFSNITTIDSKKLQTQFEKDNLAGCYIPKTDNLYIGLEDDLGYFPLDGLARLANVILHEVIHRKQKEINPKSKPHGKLFQKLCLKYGLDPRIEIEHDKGQKLKVKVPYEPEFFISAIGLCRVGGKDFFTREDLTNEVFYASRSLVRRKDKRHYGGEEDEYYCGRVGEVYLHQYNQHYPAYRFCKYIVANYPLQDAA